AGVTPALLAARSTRQIDFTSLSDVSASFTPDYARTSFDGGTQVLHTELMVRNTGQSPVGAPLVVEIAHLSDAAVRVQNADGTAPDGNPYFDFTDFSAGRTLSPGTATATHPLTLFNPGGGQFTYDVIVLGQLNRPPTFTTRPNTEALPGVPYV